MKRVYKKPFFEVIEMTEKTGVMQERSPELGGGNAMGKENDLTWNDEVNDLWGDNSEEEKQREFQLSILDTAAGC